MYTLVGREREREGIERRRGEGGESEERGREEGGERKGRGRREGGKGERGEREGRKKREGRERREGGEREPITKNTTAVFVVYILQIHLPRWFSPTKKPVLLRLQYHDYFYHSHSKSTTAVIVVLYLYHIS